MKQLERGSDINTEDEKRPRRGVQKHLDFTSGSESPASLSPPTPPGKRKRCSKEPQINDVQVSSKSITLDDDISNLPVCTSCETVEGKALYNCKYYLFFILSAVTYLHSLIEEVLIKSKEFFYIYFFLF